MDEKQYTQEEIEAEIAKIKAMDHFEMCRLWRYTPSGHPYFDNRLPFFQVFHDRLFGELDGFTPEISKALS
jgi:hypothetical protein